MKKKIQMYLAVVSKEQMHWPWTITIDPKCHPVYSHQIISYQFECGASDCARSHNHSIIVCSYSVRLITVRRLMLARNRLQLKFITQHLVLQAGHAAVAAAAPKNCHRQFAVIYKCRHTGNHWSFFIFCYSFAWIIIITKFRMEW